MRKISSSEHLPWEGGWQCFVCGKGFARRKIFSPQQSSEICKGWKVRIVHFQQYSISGGGAFDLSLVKIEHSRRSRVFSGVENGTDHFSSIFSDGLYIQVPHVV